jgi:iron complex transport system substrate-binding protein
VLSLVFASLAGGAVACSGDRQAPGASPADTGVPEAEPGAMPVTIEHVYGATTIPALPQRVAAVGLGDADVLLALGVVPVLVPVWNGSTDDGVGEWARPLLDGADPVSLENATVEFDLEPIAAARPDLIVAVNNAIDEQRYEQLSRIAPTVLHAAGQIDWSLPWREVTTRIGASVGLPARAAAEVKEIDDLFARVRSEHPGHGEHSAALARVLEGGTLRVFSPDSGRGQLLTELGFHPAPGVADRFGGSFYLDVAAENLPTIDADLLVIDNYEKARAQLDSMPTFQALPAVRESRMIGLDPVVSDAVSMPNPLTIPYIVDDLLERISRTPVRG